jgi:hypothetical protein
MCHVWVSYRRRSSLSPCGGVAFPESGVVG